MKGKFGSLGNRIVEASLNLTSLLLPRSALLPHRGVLSGEAKPRIRVLVHRGRAEDVLRLVETQHAPVHVASVSAGAVTALHQCCWVC